MGKELRRIGAPFRQPEWSSLALLEAPDKVVEAHRNFVAAGAEVIITNNYAVVPYHHSDEFFAERGADLVDLSGRLARQAAAGVDRPVRVAGSMPPLFGSYEPAAFDPRRAAPLYRTIAEALEPHVDLWVGETLSTIGEMDLIVDTIRSIGSQRPVWMSFSLPDDGESDRPTTLRSGESLRDVVSAIARIDHPLEAVLINCSLPEGTGPALSVLRRELDGRGLTTIRTGGYANAFPHREGDYRANAVIFERRADLTADRYADIVAGWIDDGATIVGGCCDMYPEHIAELARRFG